MDMTAPMGGRLSLSGIKQLAELVSQDAYHATNHTQ